MDDCELVALISVVACGITKCCSEDEIAILAPVFTQLGDTLATISINKEIREKRALEKKEQEDKMNNSKTGKQAKECNPDHQPFNDNQAKEYNPDHYPFDGY